MYGQTNGRMIHYDLLRILAAFSVVVLHTCAQMWYAFPVQSRTWLVCNGWDALFRFGVPVFVMISGAIFLDSKKSMDIGRLYRHNILRLAVIYVLWSFLYGMWDCSRYDLSQVNRWKVYINEWVGGRYHLWFLPMMIGIYMLLPILKSWVEHAERRQIEYFLLLFVILQIGRESLRVPVLRIPVAISLINTTRVELVCSYVGYFVLGYYLSHFPFTAKRQSLIYAAGLLGSVGNVVCANALAVHVGEPRGDAYDSFTLGTFCAAVALFVLFEERVSRWKPSPGLERLLVETSTDTLGVYLMHVGVLEGIWRIKPEWFTVMPLIGIPLLAMGVFVGCTLVAGVLRRIPIIGRYVC